MPGEGANESIQELHMEPSCMSILEDEARACLSQEAIGEFVERHSSGLATRFAETWSGPEGRSLIVTQLDPADKAETRAAGKPWPSELVMERERLTDLADASLSRKKDRESFAEKMRDFESRAAYQGISDSDIASSYASMSRLLESKQAHPVNSKDRLRLVLQFASHAARPTTVDQGHHKTCAAASLEARMYTRHPAVVAKILADVALTGEYTTTNGIKVRIDSKSLEPDWEARSKWPSDGSRSFASQVFQIAAVNAKWQMAILSPSGYRVNLGDIRYEQKESGPARIRMHGDSGERLMNYGQSPPGEISRQPELKVGDVRLIHNVITGNARSDFLIENSQSGNQSNRLVSSGKELRDQLVDMRNQDLLPAIIRVHTSYSPFNSGNQTGTWHLLCITDFDDKTGKVKLDNQWGSRSDKSVDLEDLYKATLPPPSVYDVNLNEILVLYDIEPYQRDESEM